MKAGLLERLVCEACGGELALTATRELACQVCGRQTPMHFGEGLQETPIFTPPPPGLQPSPRLARGPNLGTPWRRANWRFLETEANRLPPHAALLDVGAGRGDFADLFTGRIYYALDIYPYPEIDLVCDLAQTNPLRAASFDAVLLINVLEHVYDGRGLLHTLTRILKPGGVLIVAIPFMVKMHQVPVDFARYTHYALQRMGEDNGLALEKLEGFYDPISLLGEGIGNLKNALLPTLRGWRHYAGRALTLGMEVLSAGLRGLLGPGKLQPPAQARSLAPTGYHLVYRKTLAADQKREPSKE
jgi:SAM-dependent methyltransferase